MTEAGIITRGNLPHWFVPGAAHFVTYRLAGSIPAAALEALAAKKIQMLHGPLPPDVTAAQRRTHAHKQLFVDYDRCLDGGASTDWLTRPAVAAVVRQNLYHHD